MDEGERVRIRQGVAAAGGVDLLGGGGEGDLSMLASLAFRKSRYVPVAVRWDDIVNLQLLGDLLDTQMQGIRVKLLGSHGRVDSSRQAHQASRLVLARITPSIALLALSRTVGRVCATVVSNKT